MNCTRCRKWTEEPDAIGLCRACHDYANCTYPVPSIEGRARDWKAEAEWAAGVSKAKTERLDAYILTVGTIRKTIDMWSHKATESGDAMVQVTKAICELDEHWSKAEKAQRETDRKAYAHVLRIAREAIFGLLSPTRPVGARKRAQEAMVFIDEILKDALADQAPSDSGSDTEGR